MARTWSEKKFGYISVKDGTDDTKLLDDSFFALSQRVSPASKFHRSLTPKPIFQDNLVKTPLNLSSQSKVAKGSPITPSASSFATAIPGPESSRLLRYASVVRLSSVVLLHFTVLADTLVLSRTLRRKICLSLCLLCGFLLFRFPVSFPYVADYLLFSKEVTVLKSATLPAENANLPGEDTLSSQWHHIMEKQVHIILDKKWIELSEELRSKGIELWQKPILDQMNDITLASKANAKQVSQLQLDLQSKFSKRNAREISSLENLNQLKMRLSHFEEKSKHLEELFLNHKMWCNKQADVNAQLSLMVEELKANLSRMISLQNSVNSRCAKTGPSRTSDEIKEVVEAALSLYNSDKTGLVDYALESAGGSIADIHGTETYAHGSTQFTIFGVPFWKSRNSPRAVIQPQVYPGECWAMRGSAGSVIIRLFARIHLTGFSLEHIPKNLAPMGNIDSAPRDFSVLGLTSVHDTEGHLFGNYTYVDGGESLQMFYVQNPLKNSFELVELRVQSNHGNSKFTCLYRFRVHGVQQ